MSVGECDSLKKPADLKRLTHGSSQLLFNLVGIELPITLQYDSLSYSIIFSAFVSVMLLLKVLIDTLPDPTFIMGINGLEVFCW